MSSVFISYHRESSIYFVVTKLYYASACFDEIMLRVILQCICYYVWDVGLHCVLITVISIIYCYLMCILLTRAVSIKLFTAEVLS